MIWISLKVEYIIPNGMAYNSYVIVDDKIVVFDTIDKSKTGEWLDNLAEVLGGKNAGLSCRAAHGTGSLRVHQCFCRKISEDSDRWKQENIHYDRTVFPGT